MLIRVLLLLTLLACSSSVSAKKQVYGRVEYVSILPIQATMKAKIDTGASMSSLHAQDLRKFKKNNQSMIEFSLQHKANGKNTVVQYPISGYVKIKKRYQPNMKKTYNVRPYIKLRICLGNKVREIEVNLINRGYFHYPMLLGRSAIKQFEMIIDPAKKFTVGKKCQIANYT